MNILEEYCDKNEASLVMVTHDEEIAKKCNTIYKLQNYGLHKLTK
jgi:putative ABC transport system ATP-binding protein